MYSVFCLEDSADYQFLISKVLSDYSVTFASNIKEAWDLYRTKEFDVALLDINLPDGDGLKFFASIRADNFRTPVIILTSSQEIENKLTAFQLGADDYTCKPIDSRELRARVESKIKHKHERQILKFGPLELSPADLKIYVTNLDKKRNCVEVTAKQLKLLVAFVENPNQILSRDVLIDKAWGAGANITDRVVDTHICNIRKKLEGSSLKIESIPTFGYKLIVPELIS